MRFAHDLDPVVLWDDDPEAEVREVRPILSTVESAEDRAPPWVERRV